MESSAHCTAVMTNLMNDDGIERETWGDMWKVCLKPFLVDFSPL